MNAAQDMVQSTERVIRQMVRDGMTRARLSSVLKFNPSMKDYAADALTIVFDKQPQKSPTIVEPEPVAPVETVVEPVQTAPAVEIVPEETVPDEELTDERLAEIASEYIHLGGEAAANKLVEDFDGITLEDAKTFVLRALEQKLEDEKAYADEMQKAAADSRDKELEAKREADRQFVDNYCLARNKKRPTTQEDYEKYARIIQLQLAQEERDAEWEDRDVEEKFPECPVLPGTLTDLARAMFPSLPLEFKQFALITHFGLLRSGIDTFALEPHIQPRFFGVLVSPPNRGKTACINESRNAMKVIDGMITMATSDKQPRVCRTPELLTSADSGQFLVEQLVDLAKEARRAFDTGSCLDASAKALLDPDELADVFEKARTSQGRVSTLFIEILKLHSTNRTGSGTKTDGKKKVENAHLAILAGTQTRKYPMLWTGTGGGADGLRSRFISIATNNPPVPPVPLPSDILTVGKAYERLARLAQLPGQNIQLSPEATATLHHWWQSFDNSKDSATRVLEFVKQLLIVLAVTNAPDDHAGTTLTVGPDLMQAAIRFGDYVIAVRERLNPGDSWTHVQAMENAIIQWAKQRTTKSDPGSMRDCRRIIHPERLPGGLGTFMLAWRNCINAEVLKWVRKDGKSDKYTG